MKFQHFVELEASCPISIRSILIFSFHLCAGLPNDRQDSSATLFYSEWSEIRRCFTAVAFQVCFRMCHLEGPRKPGDGNWMVTHKLLVCADDVNFISTNAYVPYVYMCVYYKAKHRIFVGCWWVGWCWRKYRGDWVNVLSTQCRAR
jgi:hypothetical protein